MLRNNSSLDATLKLESSHESILGGDLDPFLDLLVLLLDESALVIEISIRFLFPHDGNPATYDRLLSPSFLNFSMIVNISFLPPSASIIFPAMLMLILVWLFAFSSLFISRCRICIQT